MSQLIMNFSNYWYVVIWYLFSEILNADILPVLQRLVSTIIQRLAWINLKIKNTLVVFHTWKYVFNGSSALCNDHVMFDDFSWKLSSD